MGSGHGYDKRSVRTGRRKRGLGGSRNSASDYCATIFMGVDSGSPEIRRHLMERPMTDELIYKSAQAVKDAGIGLQISCIYGNPGETPEQMFGRSR